jgi:hypothetical protein
MKAILMNGTPEALLTARASLEARGAVCGPTRGPLGRENYFLASVPSDPSTLAAVWHDMRRAGVKMETEPEGLYDFDAATRSMVTNWR